MALTKPELACETVLLSLKVSRLAFSVQETPYSCYITIRKKFVVNYQHQLSPVIEDLKSTDTCEHLENLVIEHSSSLEDISNKNKALREALNSIKNSDAEKAAETQFSQQKF